MTHGGDACYRLSRSYLYTGIGGTAFFLLIGAASSAAAYWNLDGSFARPQEAAIGFGVFWSLCVLLGVYLIVIAIRYRLYVNTLQVEQIGCVRTREIRLDEVSLARWRLFPKGGSLSLRGFDRKLTIYFSNFDANDRWTLIAMFRERLPEHVQDGWQRFEARFRKRRNAGEQITTPEGAST